MNNDINKEQYKHCFFCDRDLEEKNFYRFKDNTSDCFCIECLTKNINDNQESSFLGLFKRYDIPYFPEEWDSLRQRRIKKCIDNQNQYTTIFGQYLAKMKLCGFKGYSFKDSAKIIAGNNYVYNNYYSDLTKQIKEQILWEKFYKESESCKHE